MTIPGGPGASRVELKPSSTLGITRGRAGAGKTKPPPTSRDGKGGGGAFLGKTRQPRRIKQNKHLTKHLQGAWKCEPQGKQLRLWLGQAEVRAGEGKDREVSGCRFLVLEALCLRWSGLPSPCTSGHPLPPCPGCWPCLAQRGLCPAAGKESSVCSELLSAALCGLFALGEEQSRFTGLFCKYCVL